jgi:diguanylate cyclase (GGDEF)-like protein
MKRLNKVTKYTICICVGLVLFNLIFGAVLTRVSALVMRTQIDQRMLDISNTAAAMLDGDDLAKITADDYGSPEYDKVMETLTYFMENIELEYIYCIIQQSEKEFVFGVDPTIDDPGEFGSPIVYTDALYKASKGTASVDHIPYVDRWGTFYSAYSPVFDSNGNVAAIVAVDFSADWYHNKLRKQFLIILGFICLALFASIWLAIGIVAHYNKFFETLIKKMNDLSNGIETLIDEVVPIVDAKAKSQPMSLDVDSNMNNAMEILGEKILLMQIRLSKQIEIIRSHAYIDGLTGLYNRNSYMEYLKILEKKIEEVPELVFSVVVFDINQLKIINDDFGHDTGDKLIIAISGDIRDVFGNDRVYRVGGDEFVVILDDPDPSDKIAQVKSIIARKNMESPIFHNPEVEVGLSAGAAAFDADTDRTYSEVFNRADNAMYADKREFYRTHEDRRKRRG